MKALMNKLKICIVQRIRNKAYYLKIKPKLLYLLKNKYYLFLSKYKITPKIVQILIKCILCDPYDGCWMKITCLRTNAHWEANSRGFRILNPLEKPVQNSELK